MDNKYMCKRCRCAGAKSLVPYKIIKDVDGESVKFVAQLCERCYNDLFEQPAAQEQKTKEE